MSVHVMHSDVEQTRPSVSRSLICLCQRHWKRKSNQHSHSLRSTTSGCCSYTDETWILKNLLLFIVARAARVWKSIKLWFCCQVLQCHFDIFSVLKPWIGSQYTDPGELNVPGLFSFCKPKRMIVKFELFKLWCLYLASCFLCHVEK